MITAEQVLASLPSRTQQINMPPIPEAIRQMSIERQLYIFNVGPTMWPRYSGSLGTFVIQAKPDGARYSAPSIIPGIMSPPLLVDEGKVSREQYDGMDVAKDLVGNGPWRDKSDDLTHFGVFISRTNPPTEEELQAAEAQLSDHDFAIIAEANRFYENNGGVDTKSGMSNVGTKEQLAAARRRGVTPKWARKGEQLMSCPACDESIKPNAAICVHCDAILDEEKARKFYPHKFAADKRGPGRPAKEAVDA